MEHVTTVTTGTRQLGRTRVTDHYWSCSCGSKCTAPTGYRTERDARVNALFHRKA